MKLAEFATILALMIICPLALAQDTNAITDYLPYLGQPSNSIPSEAKVLLDELAKSAVPTPEIAREIVFNSLPQEDKDFMGKDARCTFPRVIQLQRLEKDLSQDAKAGDIAWTVGFWIRSPEEKRQFIVIARTGKTIAPNQGVERLLLATRAKPQCIRSDPGNGTTPDRMNRMNPIGMTREMECNATIP